MLMAYRVNHHGARPYDIAQALGVSELQVLMYSTDIMTVTPLDIGFAELFEKFTDLGLCMALTRNDSTVSEVKGVYGKPSFHGPMGMVHHDAIDLRMLLAAGALRWRSSRSKARMLCEAFRSSINKGVRFIRSIRRV